MQTTLTHFSALEQQLGWSSSGLSTILGVQRVNMMGCGRTEGTKPPAGGSGMGWGLRLGLRPPHNQQYAVATAIKAPDETRVSVCPA